LERQSAALHLPAELLEAKLQEIEAERLVARIVDDSRAQHPDGAAAHPLLSAGANEAEQQQRRPVFHARHLSWLFAKKNRLDASPQQSSKCCTHNRPHGVFTGGGARDGTTVWPWRCCGFFRPRVPRSCSQSPSRCSPS